MTLSNILAATAALAILAAPAMAQQAQPTQQPEQAQQAQQSPMTEEEMAAADEAAERMVATIYIREPVTQWTAGEVIARLQELGYTNISEFDVEWGHYEVEAMAPNGNEVEIEIDPITGAILDIEDNWF